MGSLRHRAASMFPVPTLPAPEEDLGAKADGIVQNWAAYWAQLYADLSESLQGVALQGALPVQVGWDDGGRFLGQGGVQVLSRSAGRLLGWSLLETADAAVTLRFYDGDESAALNAGHGTPVAATQLAANGHENEALRPTSFSDGLSVGFAGTGQVWGVVLIGGVD
jgi:hypothetical protein